MLRTYVYEQRQKIARGKQRLALESGNALPLISSTVIAVPLLMYFGLSLLRAIDLGMTNLSMQYINYPAKTLMKSSRVVFTMMFGVFIARKKYRPIEYLVVFFMCCGLAIFMHADAQHSAVFQPIGVVMLVSELRARENGQSLLPDISHSFVLDLILLSSPWMTDNFVDM